MSLTDEGRTFSSNEMQRDAFFAEPIALPLAKALAFRRVSKEGVGRCSW